ncbi:MAG: SusC/RagA family TonB-linked outer membrane protein, partial [Bacteroidales bacterium]|nr:SusC/RagA family TonB-linked outer membrane protein [Bacteroidales bacterium]
LDWLTYRLNLGVTLNDSDSHNWANGFAYAYGETDVFSNAGASANRRRTYLVENTLNFNKSLGNHNIAGVVGQSYQDDYNRGLGAGSKQLIQTAGGLYLKNVSSGTADFTSSGSSSQHRLISYFGRINYNYAEKYLAQVTVRRDGTSRFGDGHRWGTFPSFSLGWRISKEPWYNLSWMNDLKIRANYGTLGSQNVGNYDYQSLINSYCAYQLDGTSTLYTGQAITEISNTDIAWETKTTTNVGVDMAFLNNKLQVSLEWYDSESNNVLYRQPILKSVGSTSNPVVNSASISNKGVELTMNYNNQINQDWSYSVGLNLAHNENTIKSLGYGVPYHDNGEVTLSKVGYPIGMFSLAVTDGLYQTDAEAQADGLIASAHAGDVKYIDYNKDGSITDADRQLLEDKSPWPKLEVGLNLNVNYKHWGLQVNGFGQFFKWVYNGPRAMYDALAGLNQVSTAYFNNIWSETNKHNDVRYPRTAWGYTMNDVIYSDRWLERGDFFKFSTLSLSYEFIPKGVLSTVLQSAKFYVSSQNLLCLTAYSGLDPDFIGTDLFAPGVDPLNEYMRHLNYNPVSFIFGVNVTF